MVIIWWVECLQISEAMVRKVLSNYGSFSRKIRLLPPAPHAGGVQNYLSPSCKAVPSMVNVNL